MHTSAARMRSKCKSHFRLLDDTLALVLRTELQVTQRKKSRGFETCDAKLE